MLEEKLSYVVPAILTGPPKPPLQLWLGYRSLKASVLVKKRLDDFQRSGTRCRFETEAGAADRKKLSSFTATVRQTGFDGCVTMASHAGLIDYGATVQEYLHQRL